MGKNYVIGLDFGTDSVRAMIIDTLNGVQLGESIFYYPRWATGKYCYKEIGQFRQHPLDHIEGLEASICGAIKNAGSSTVAENIRAIGVGTTASTPVALDRSGNPLSLLPEFAENPNAMFILWKDHTAVKEAAEINAIAHSEQFEDYTAYSGGTYSAEWFWAKILHIIRIDPAVSFKVYSWIEHCDWIPALLTGNTKPHTMCRSRCAAGHKAMWHESFGGLPPEDFLYAIEPPLAEFRTKLYSKTHTANTATGTLCSDWAKRLGLSEDVIIAGGSIDAHLAAVGAGIQPNDMVKVIGTSSCDMVMVPTKHMNNKLIKGICGQVEDSIIRGYTGLEAGQSAFGDVYTWFKDMLLAPSLDLIDSTTVLDAKQRDTIKKEMQNTMLSHLNAEASKTQPQQTLIGLDWINGRRTPYANQLLTGAVTGLKLGSTAYQIYHAFIEAAAFGARAIQDTFQKAGIRINRVIAVGGVAKKEDFIMQILADILDRTIYVSSSEQCTALGSAMMAAVTANIYSSVPLAQRAMGEGVDKKIHPRSAYTQMYKDKYKRYLALGAFSELQTELMSH